MGIAVYFIQGIIKGLLIKKNLMKLRDYCEQNTGSQQKLASVLNVSVGFVSHMVKGRRAVPPRHCPKIEQATGGQVTRRDLRPDDWHEIWPELKD